MVKLDNSHKILDFNKIDDLNTSMNKLNSSVFSNKILSKKLDRITDFNLNDYVKSTMENLD